MKTVYVNDDMLGSDATEKDVQLMVKLLRKRGYDARIGQGNGADIPDRVWNDCLDKIYNLHYKKK